MFAKKTTVSDIVVDPRRDSRGMLQTVQKGGTELAVLGFVLKPPAQCVSAEARHRRGAAWSRLD